MHCVLIHFLTQRDIDPRLPQQRHQERRRDARHGPKGHDVGRPAEAHLMEGRGKGGVRIDLGGGGRRGGLLRLQHRTRLTLL